jgi:hypothetical protein
VSLRRGLALVLLAVFVLISASLAPWFLRNLRLQQYMENLTQSAQIDTHPPEWFRSQVVERARQLGLPVEERDVQVEVSGATVRLAARYVVPVDLPGYTVKLHFAPSGGR